MIPAVKIENLKKTYKDVKALKGVNLEIREGELYGLLGLNGAGKTTLASILCGLIPFDGGKVEIFGSDMQKEPDKVKTLTDISPQETSVAPNLTVKENLEFFARIYGKSIENVDRIIDEFSLNEVASKRAKTLSGGYARRLSIAIALVSEPRLLLLDEPTLGLDVLARRELWKIIKGLKERITIILTTHYLEEIEELCDRVGILKNGEKLFDGTVEQLKTETDETTFENAFVKLLEE